MLGEAQIKTDVTCTTPTTFVLGTVTGGRLIFAVEESEMVVELGFLGTVAPTTADTAVDFTLFVDGVDQADLVDGLLSGHGGKTTGLGDIPVCFAIKKRFTKGSHLVELRVRAAAGNVVVKGLLRPCKLTATRWSHNAVVAPAANSKQVSGSY